jgi:hypothetical protein
MCKISLNIFGNKEKYNFLGGAGGGWVQKNLKCFEEKNVLKFWECRKTFCFLQLIFLGWLIGGGVKKCENYVQSNLS